MNTYTFNHTMCAWVDAAITLIMAWDGWPELRADLETTRLVLEVQAEQYWTQMIDDGMDPTIASVHDAAASIAAMTVHWWVTEGKTVRDPDERR